MLHHVIIDGKEHVTEVCFRHLIGAEEDKYRSAEGLRFPNICVIRVRYTNRQKLCESAKGPCRKFWTQTKILNPNIGYFVAISRFVAFYALFGELLTKKVLFGSKTAFLGQEVHYYMVYIAYFTELILQICDYAHKRRI